MDEAKFREIQWKKQSPEIGSRWPVRWTSCFRYYEAIGEVKKVNEKTIVIALVDRIPRDYWIDGVPVPGQTFRVPRGGVMNPLWSLNHCLVDW